MLFKVGDKVKHISGKMGTVVNPKLEGIEYKKLNGTWQAGVAIRLDEGGIYDSSPSNLRLIE